MFVLDTNVVSELMKPIVASSVEIWCASQPRDSLYITAITQAEILYGIAILPAGNRQKRLLSLAQAMFREDFATRILPFEQKSAEHYATITAHRRRQGNPISQFDAQIAAICRTHRCAIATRNVDDFANCQIKILNPWEA
jgi:predicted nucleic acid-binding protein